MENFNVILVRGHRRIMLLGRESAEYLKREFALCDLKIVENVEQAKEALEKGRVNVVLYDDMPLVTAADIQKYATLMKRRGYHSLRLGGSDSPALISFGEGEGDVFAKDEAFLRITDARSYSDTYELMRRRILRRAQEGGALILSPHTTTVDDAAILEGCCIIEGNCRIEGNTRIESGARVYMSYIKDSVIGEGAEVKFSHITDSNVGKNSTVGPFARLRGANVDINVRIGDFVEIKASSIGEGVKAAHLAYVGDAEVGEGTNIGCGSVFCNFDGKQKHKSKVGKNCFIGANVNLVAPIEVGDNAYIAAGATCSKDIAENSFTIAKGARPDSSRPRRAEINKPTQ